MAAIKRRLRLRRIRHLCLAALAPGGGHLSAGRYGWGVFFWLPASFFLARVLVTRNAFPSPWPLSLGGGGGLVTAGLVIYLLWWAMSLWQT